MGTARGTRRGKRRPPHQGRGVREWVGGRLVSPFYITEGGPYRPEMILWLELPAGLVVGTRIVDPKEPPVSFAATLLDLTKEPMVGPPRRPARVRVSDERLAAEVRTALPEAQVMVAPTPELDQLLAHMASSMPADGEAEQLSYFEDGRVPEETVEALFRAAELLYRIAPWKVAADGQVLRLDIPQLGVKGACVSIIGALGESFGLIIFPSLEAFERFRELAQAGAFSADGPIDLGTSSLSLNFERASDLPPSLRREAAEHGWPVAGPDAYPWVQHRDRDGTLRPLAEQDVKVVTACATSLATFFIKHGDLFGRESISPVCESFFDENNFEVRFTVPYDAGPLFEVNDPSGGRPRTKRGRRRR